MYIFQGKGAFGNKVLESLALRLKDKTISSGFLPQTGKISSK